MMGSYVSTTRDTSTTANDTPYVFLWTHLCYLITPFKNKNLFVVKYDLTFQMIDYTLILTFIF